MQLNRKYYGSIQNDKRMTIVFLMHLFTFIILFKSFKGKHYHFNNIMRYFMIFRQLTIS